MASLETVRWRSALLEGVAVLVGILLAFGIDAAWDVRQERQETLAYLGALRVELESNRSQVLSDIESLGRTIGETHRTLERIAAPGATPSYEETVELLQQISPRPVPQLSQAALTDLQSSGGFTRIESAALRMAVSGYESALIDDEAEQEGVRRFFDDFLHPYDVSEGSIIAKNPTWHEMLRVPELNIDWTLPMEAYVANRVYANLLMARMFTYNAARGSRGAVLQRIEEVLGAMDGAI